MSDASDTFYAQLFDAVWDVVSAALEPDLLALLPAERDAQSKLIVTAQNEPHPPGDYATIDIIAGPTRIGWADRKRRYIPETAPAAGDDKVMTSMAVQRRFTVQVQTFGPTAFERLAAAFDRIETDEVEAIIEARGLALVGTEAIIDISEKVGEVWTAGASGDIIFMTASDTEEKETPFFNKVVVNGTTIGG